MNAQWRQGYINTYRLAFTHPMPVGFTPGDATGEAKRKAAVEQAQKELQVVSGVRAQLYKLQASMAELPDVDFPLQHVFAPGVVARTIILPAGSVIVGKIHKHQHLNILSKGHVRVLTEAGGVEELRGPLVMTSEPGTKRAVYAITEAIWTTIHLTNKTDPDEIVEEATAPDYAAYEEFVRSKLENKS